MAATLIIGANVWDGTSPQAASQQVLVVDGRIQRVADAIDPPPDAHIVNLPGRTLTPGFIDCHTHVALAPPVGLMQALDSSTAKTLKALPVLRALLDNGFTTVRDVGCGDLDYPTVDLRSAVAAGLVVGPRMVVAPHIISARGGHGDFSGMVADEYQGCCRDLELACADGAGEIRTRVRQQIRAGVRSIEHGNLASAETLTMMQDAGVFMVPTQYVILSKARADDDDPDWATLTGTPAANSRNTPARYWMQRRAWPPAT